MTDDTRRYEIITGLVVLSMSLGLLLAGEIALRAIQWVRFGQQESVETSSAYFIDEDTGLRLNHPDHRLGQIRINNLGFRGPDIAPEKPGATIRLAFLGSSTTYDAYSGEGKNWPHLVANYLSERLEHCRVDFVNGGKPGYGTRQMISLYEHYMAPTEPDLLLILPSDANSELDAEARAQGLETDHTRYQSPLNPYSLLLQKLEKNFRIIRLQRGAGVRSGKLEVDRARLSREFRDTLEHLVTALSADDRPLALITLSGQLRAHMSIEEMARAGNTRLYYMPYIYLPDVVALREAYNEVMADVAGDYANVVLVGGEEEIPGDPAHYHDSVHFTPRGSRVMAQRVVHQLVAKPEVQSLVREKGCGLIEP